MGTLNTTKNIVNKTKNDIDVESEEKIDTTLSGADLSKTMSTVNSAFVKKQNTSPEKVVKNVIKKSVKSNIKSNKRSK